MSNPKPSQFPIHLLFLDVVGVALIGAGVFVLLGTGELPGLEGRDLTLYAWPSIVFGVAFCLPLILHLVRRSPRQQV